MGTRKRRRSQDTSANKAVRSNESGRTQGVESGGQRAGDINARTMGVTAAQESEAGKDAQGRERQGERMSEENDNSKRETKRIREEDNGHMGNDGTQKEKAAEHKCRRTLVAEYSRAPFRIQ